MTIFTIVMAIVTAALIGTFGVAMFKIGYHASGYWEMNDRLRKLRDEALDEHRRGETEEFDL